MPLDLDQLEALLEKASALPWRVRENRHTTTDGQDWGWVSHNTNDNISVSGMRIEWTGDLGYTNAVLLAQAVSALPALIQAARRAEALEACALKYLAWHSVESPKDGLESDLRNVDMCGDKALKE